MNTLYIFIAAMVISFIVAHKKQHLKNGMQPLIIVAVMCGLMGFLLYVMINIIVLELTSLSQHAWLVVPATLIIVWRFYAKLYKPEASKRI